MMDRWLLPLLCIVALVWFCPVCSAPLLVVACFFADMVMAVVMVVVVIVAVVVVIVDVVVVVVFVGH